MSFSYRIWQCHPKLSTLASVSLKPQALSFEWVPKLENKVSQYCLLNELFAVVRKALLDIIFLRFWDFFWDFVVSSVPHSKSIEWQASKTFHNNNLEPTAKFLDPLIRPLISFFVPPSPLNAVQF